MNSSIETILPQHLAVIMDGNGRWAEQRGFKRSEGHIQGVKTLRALVKAAAQRGIKYMTVYAFSTENWVRPSEEVNHLMDLFAQSLTIYTEELDQEGVRLLAIGDLDRLPDASRKELNRSIERTSSNSRLTLIVALSYSSHYEINKAFCMGLEKYYGGDKKELPCDPYDNPIEPFLNTVGIPNPDLLIRTGGEMRLSNFLLYQMAYTELYFTDTLWPDFDDEKLEEALKEYSQRERRFGTVKTIEG